MIGELLIVFALLEVYSYIRSLADTRYAAALANGRGILDLERHLRIDIELGVNQWLVEHDAVSRVASEVYQHTHTGLTISVLLGCYVLGPALYRPARNALVLINLVGLVVFFLYPVMPPRLLPGSGFVDTVAGAGYGTAHSGPVSMSPAQYAAMPSLHMAWALWVTAVVMAVLWRYRVRWLAVLHSVVTAVVIVATANHYVLDVVAGAVVAWAAILLFGLPWAHHGTTYCAGQLIRRPGRTPDTPGGGRPVVPRDLVPNGAPARTGPAAVTTFSPPTGKDTKDVAS